MKTKIRKIRSRSVRNNQREYPYSRGKMDVSLKNSVKKIPVQSNAPPVVYLRTLKEITNTCTNFFNINSKKIKNWNITERKDNIKVTIIFSNDRDFIIDIIFFQNKKEQLFLKDINSKHAHITISEKVSDVTLLKKLNLLLNIRYYGYLAEDEVISILGNLFSQHKNYFQIETATEDQNKLEETDIFLKYNDHGNIKSIPIDIKRNKRAASFRKKNSKRATITLSHILKIKNQKGGNKILLGKIFNMTQDYFNRKIPWPEKRIYL
jgi:hypothetical protein